MKIDPRLTHDNERMMREPEWWASWPFLPIKNTRELDDVGFPKCALLVDLRPELIVITQRGTEPTIYFLKDGNLFLTPSKEQMATCVEADVTQLLLDGWVVD